MRTELPIRGPLDALLTLRRMTGRFRYGQEVATMIRYGQNPIIFLINNGARPGRSIQGRVPGTRCRAGRMLAGAALPPTSGASPKPYRTFSSRFLAPAGHPAMVTIVLWWSKVST
jgi:hypothetical protein